MRKYARSLTLFLLSSVVLMASCKKESTTDGIVPPPDSTNTRLILNNLFAGTKIMTPRQTLEVDAGGFAIARGNRGTRLRFYPNSFKDKSGNIITTGQINIELVEMYNPGEVIANRSSATSVGRLLRSGGQVYIRATRAGQEVFPTKYGIGFPAYNTNATPPMALFYGNNVNPDSIINWTQASLKEETGTVVNGTFTDTSNGFVYYQFDSCTSFNWVNCDYFYNITGAQMVNLSLVSKDSVDLDKINTQVFLVFPSINSVTYMNTFNPETKTWTLGSTFHVPANMTFHAVSISLRNGEYYYSDVKNLTTRYEFVDTLRPEKKTLNEVITSLISL